jgi:hypothetical protein
MARAGARRCWRTRGGDLTLWVLPVDLDDETLLEVVQAGSSPSGYAPREWVAECEVEWRRRYIVVGGTAQEWAEALPELRG